MIKVGMAIKHLNIGFYMVALAVVFAGAMIIDEYYPESGAFYRTHSNLTEVPADIPEEAREVYLYGNQITEVKRGSFSQLQNCREVYLYRNAISTVETGAFQGLSNVRHLNIYENRLQAIRGGMWKGLRSLTDLSLSENNIRSLAPGSFQGLVRLEYLSLWRNDLHEIRGDLFQPLVSLERLMLGENKLNTIEPGTFINLLNLEILRLQGNELTTIPKAAFVDPDCPDDHPNRLELIINVNPIQCDSRLCWLKQAETDGWITLDGGWWMPPTRCDNTTGPAFENVTLGCA